MSRCRHTCWLKPWSLGIEKGLEVTDRPQRLLKEFENPDAESAGLLVLIGNQSKQAAFKKLSFQTGRIRARAGGEVHLLVSSLKENRRKRIVIADTDASGSQAKLPLLSASACHAVKVYTDTKQQVPEDGLDYENLLRRTLLPSADVVCIFVDDLGGFGESLKRLRFWLQSGPPSTSPVRPHILLVVRQEWRQRHESDLQRFVAEHRSRSIDPSFSSITLVGVPRMSGKSRRRSGGQTRRWQVLSSELSKALETSRQARRRSDSIFSVHHLAHFLQYAASVALSVTAEPFSFVKVSRLHRGIAPDLSDHIRNFLGKFELLKTFQQVAVPLIASSLLLDHYSPGMHPFDCHQVFRELYENACYQASSELESSFKMLISPSETSQALGSMRDWHRQQLARNFGILRSIVSNDTCLSCIGRRPQYGFPCGHLVCQNCIRTFSPKSSSDPWEYVPQSCHICGQPTPGISIRLFPDTSRLRVLSIDGGGIRGSAPIGFLKAIQDEIGIPYYNVQRSFDVKVGTSSGALSVICLDILGWNVDDCMSHLKQFAQQSFIQRSSWFTRLLDRLPLFSNVAWLFQLICTLLADSKYTAEGLEKLLIETYGQNRSTTDISPATAIGAHVGVTLTRAYDGSRLDYRHLELNDGQSQSKWWQVYFKPARIGDLGVFQDGGLAVNNPVCIAIREATLLSPEMAEPSIVVSLGTGSASDDDNRSSGILSEKFLPRLSRALWKQTGSKVTWSHLLSHQRADSDTKLFRFDVNFVGEEPLLDEVSMVERVRQTAHDTATRSSSLRRLCRHLRAELFLFELDELHPPYFLRGAYQCAGRIICRLRAYTPEYKGFIRQLCERQAAFRNINTDLCYKVNFTVPTLSSSISIALLEGADEESHINGSPFAIEWLIRRQALECRLWHIRSSGTGAF
ncbi:acyl transferase/acyl hydrolase/lysophospholipase [Fusarium oxysporum]|nr:acyl transferase/acyl hydrolase/lysophospholipase [Fusarium oxysporum]